MSIKDWLNRWSPHQPEPIVLEAERENIKVDKRNVDIALARLRSSTDDLHGAVHQLARRLERIHQDG